MNEAESAEHQGDETPGGEDDGQLSEDSDEQVRLAIEQSHATAETDDIQRAMGKSLRDAPEDEEWHTMANANIREMKERSRLAAEQSEHQQAMEASLQDGPMLENVQSSGDDEPSADGDPSGEQRSDDGRSFDEGRSFPPNEPDVDDVEHERVVQQPLGRALSRTGGGLSERAAGGRRTLGKRHG